MVGRLDIGIGADFWTGGAGGVEAFGLVRTFAPTGTTGANIAFVHQPDADGGDHGPVADAVDETLEH